jgi:hypothetical protein
MCTFSVFFTREVINFPRGERRQCKRSPFLPILLAQVCLLFKVYLLKPSTGNKRKERGQEAITPPDCSLEDVHLLPKM